MNLRLLFCIAMGIFTTFIGLVMLIARFRTPPEIPLPPKPNFSAAAQTFTDEKTGETLTERDFTVTTKLTDRPPHSDPEP